jgi:hypothetical protein
MRVAEERTLRAEHYSQQIDQHYRERIDALEARMVRAERRIQSADARAVEAEEWLLRLQGAIENGFPGVLRAQR